jgi:hypothetical protein
MMNSDTSATTSLLRHVLISRYLVQVLYNKRVYRYYWTAFWTYQCGLLSLYTRRNKLRGLYSASKLYRLSYRHLLVKFSATFADRGVSRGQRGGTPTAVSLSFVDRNRHFFFQVAPRLSLRGWVDPIPDPLLLRKYCSAGIRTRDLYLQPGTLTTREQRRSLVNI